MITLYGIKNCDTVKKARKWLDEHHAAYRFHDYKVEGVDEKTLRGWVRELGWEALLNTRGTTWRRFPEDLKQDMDEEKAIQIMLQNPSVIKRPVLDLGNERRVGFNPAEYESRLKDRV